jgi:hypothetical protein
VVSKWLLATQQWKVAMIHPTVLLRMWQNFFLHCRLVVDVVHSPVWSCTPSYSSTKKKSCLFFVRSCAVVADRLLPMVVVPSRLQAEDDDDIVVVVDAVESVVLYYDSKPQPNGSSNRRLEQGEAQGLSLSNVFLTTTMA